MLVQDAEARCLEIELRQQAHYWRAQHARATEREGAWKDKAQRLEQVVRQQQAQIAKLAGELGAAKARIGWLEKQVFGRKSEQCPGSEPGQRDPAPAHDGHADVLDEPELGNELKRKRGKQPGAKGHGRKRRQNLSAEDVVHDLPKDQRQCPRCGTPFDVFPSTEDSEQIEWEVVLYRRIHKRSQYVRTCDCEVVPGIVAAPGPPKLIPKGMFATSFWVRLLMEKFLFQRPLHRVRKVLALEGLSVSQGTLTGGLQRIGELLQPVYTRILERSRTANHWKMDETRWLVFEEVEGKKGYRWWLWVVITEDTVAFLLEPTRSAQVPRDHLGKDPAGVISADRYSVYKALGKKILVAFCWSHVRRDFVRVRDGYRRLRPWGEAWIARINELFKLNDERLAVLSDPEAFQEKDRVLRDAVEAMAKQRESELEDPDLRKPARKALKSLRNHWEGCILFVDQPEIPMDNNESERRLRDPAVGRKNYYGSGSIWSGALTAMCFTIFQTLLKNGIDPKKWFFAYFEACAENSGRPPDNIDEFMPWHLSDQQKDAWPCPEPFT
jgi:transposase